ncbi:surface protease GP63 [Trypanosoma cruzi]|nr:surface protease GP63 [Trypanosoma cruzi]
MALPPPFFYHCAAFGGESCRVAEGDTLLLAEADHTPVRPKAIDIPRHLDGCVPKTGCKMTVRYRAVECKEDRDGFASCSTAAFALRVPACVDNILFFLLFSIVVLCVLSLCMQE